MKEIDVYFVANSNSIQIFKEEKSNILKEKSNILKKTLKAGGSEGNRE